MGKLSDTMRANSPETEAFLRKLGIAGAAADERAETPQWVEPAFHRTDAANLGVGTPEGDKADEHAQRTLGGVMSPATIQALVAEYGDERVVRAARGLAKRLAPPDQPWLEPKRISPQWAEEAIRAQIRDADRHADRAWVARFMNTGKNGDPTRDQLSPEEEREYKLDMELAHPQVKGSTEDPSWLRNALTKTPSRYGPPVR